jgi:hypothetical protein
MNRQSHLEWCKKRAHEYLAKGDIQNAVTSMLSDLSKHPETEGSSHGIFAQLGMMAVMSGDRREAARFIDGFN